MPTKVTLNVIFHNFFVASVVLCFMVTCRTTEAAEKLPDISLNDRLKRSDCRSQKTVLSLKGDKPFLTFDVFSVDIFTLNHF